MGGATVLFPLCFTICTYCYNLWRTHTEAVHMVRVDHLHCAQSVLRRVIVMWNSHCTMIILPVVSCVRASYERRMSLLK
jgi:hypothetical protein